MVAKKNVMEVEEGTATNPAQELAELKARVKEAEEAAKKLKADALEKKKALREAIKAEREARKAAGKTLTYSRMDATLDIIKGGISGLTPADVADLSNNLYKERKGTPKSDNIREAKAVAKGVFQVLLGMEILTIVEGKFV